MGSCCIIQETQPVILRLPRGMGGESQEGGNIYVYTHTHLWLICRASQMSLVVKILSANAGGMRDASLIPESERSPGGAHGNPLKYSCLENPMDSVAWWATVHRVTKIQIWLKQLSTHPPTHTRLIRIVLLYGRNQHNIVKLSSN